MKQDINKIIFTVICGVLVFFCGALTCRLIFGISSVEPISYTLVRPMVYDAFTGKPIANATVVNTYDGSVYTTDANGSTDWISVYYKENDDTAIEIKDTWFRYEKDSPDVIKGLNLKVGKGEFLAIVGGNGTGKTTTLSLVAGLNTPYRGKVLINGKNIAKNGDLCGSVISMLPQDPRCVFVKKTVRSDLEEILSEKRLTKDEIEQRIHAVTSLCRIERLVEGHPYDLSGGEQQRAALAKVLLTEPEILLLDEPTKGMDTSFKKEFARIIADLQSRGVTVVAVSHDMEFCAAYADRCAMFFDGAITACGTPKEFFSGNNFYTTAANRMARGVIENALLAEDIINALR